jgi:hypothetical protein
MMTSSSKATPAAVVLAAAVAALVLQDQAVVALVERLVRVAPAARLVRVARPVALRSWTVAWIRTLATAVPARATDDC